LTATTSQELVNLPYGARQNVVVVPDEVLAPPVPPPRPIVEGGPLRANLVKVRQRLPEWAPGSTKPQLPASLRLIRDLREESLLVVPLATSEAVRLRMPVGHPRPNVLYIGDPVEAPRYYPAADFHRRVFEHKFAEAMRLVMALGATEVRVHWEKGWRGQLVGDLQAPIQKLLGAGKLRASAEKKSSLLFEASLEPQEPRVPENLVWYPYEDLWQAVADGRLNARLRQFDLTVSSTDDYGVDSTFQAKVKGKKLLSLGGEFEAHKATTWRLQGNFAPRKRVLFGR
jgi:hypothetical protein